MKTQTKISIILLFTICIFILVFFAFIANQRQQKNLLFDVFQKQQEVIINTALNNKYERLNQVMVDYTNWDNLLEFVKKPDEKWAVENIGNVITSFNLDFLLIFNANKELVHSSIRNKTLMDTTLVNQKILTILFEKHFLNYYKKTSIGLCQINGATIHHTTDLDRVDSPQGFFIIGKFWDKTVLDNFRTSTSCLVSIQLPKKEIQKKEIQKNVVVKTELTDENNNVISELVFTKENRFYESYKTFISNSSILFLGLLLSILIIFVFAFNRLIKIPLNNITESLTNPNSNKINKYLHKNNEFSQIAGLIKDFYIQIKKTEESEEKFRALAANIPGIVLVHQNGEIIYVNDNVKVTGYTPQEVMSKNIFSFLPEGSIVEIQERIEKRMMGISVEPYEVQLTDKYGNNLNMLVNAEVFSYGKEKAIIVALTDITERKHTLEQLKKQSILLQGVALATNYLLMQQDFNMAINKAVETIGITTGADRVYVYESNIDPKTGVVLNNQKYEWLSENLKQNLVKSNLKNIVVDKILPQWHKSLSEGKTIKGAVKDFLTVEMKMLDTHIIKSILIVPIFVNEAYWGFVGFDNCTTDKEWNNDEESMLITLSASIGSVILRKKTEEYLFKAMKEAQSSTESKSTFLATMSHEIRTPMNGVIGMASLLLQTKITPEQHEYVNAIRISGNNLLNIINDILDFSKIESNKMSLEEQSFDLNNVMEDVIDVLSHKINEKKLDFFYIVNPEIEKFIIGDISRLRQILVNLVGNAIKFTNKGEVGVFISGTENKDNQVIVEFKIKDTGIGISSEKLKTLFQPFTQADSSISRKFGGTGLGLVISKKLAELMGGELTVQSTLDQGSVFTFTIKTKYDKQLSLNSKVSKFANTKIYIISSHVSYLQLFSSSFIKYGVTLVLKESIAELLKEYDDNKVDGDAFIFQDSTINYVGENKLDSIKAKINKPFILFSNNSLSKSYKCFDVVINKPIKYTLLYNDLLRLLKPLEPIEGYDAVYILDSHLAEKYPLNILVAEDNIINQKLVTRMFNKMGYQVDNSANGIEVIEALKRQKYDLVFMDVQMPEMDGLEATRIIRREFKAISPCIIAMTANAMDGDREKCLEAGMDDYISKPIKLEEVELMIKKWGMNK